MDTSLVALCQINVAIGLFYIGLRSFRYQKSLSVAVKRAFQSVGCDNMDVQSSVYTSLTSRDPTFSKHHHRIAKYVARIPARQLPVAWSRFLTESSIGASPVYRLYNRGIDKLAVFVTMIVLPILLIAKLIGSYSAGFVVYVGHATVVVLIVYAWASQMIVVSRIKAAGKYMLNKINEEAARRQVQQVENSEQSESTG